MTSRPIGPMRPHTGRRAALGWLVALALLVAFAALAPALALPQGSLGFVSLTAGQRVYDETGTLTPDQIADLERRTADLVPIGLDTVIYVRELDADPDETLDQVEDLQQTWVQSSGVNQDVAGAILINREPGDPNSARVGIFVGRTLEDGNLPADEREEIIEDELIPPLRDGDVYGSLVAGLIRMDSSIRNGPPRNALERFADRSVDSWLPWTAIGTTIIGAAGSVSLFGRRKQAPAKQPIPTTRRPGDFSPALAGALVAGSPQASAMSATILDLAGQGALAIEPESAGGKMSKPKIQIRLVDQRVARGEVEQAVWTELEKLAGGDRVVPSKQLTKISGRTRTTYAAIRTHMREQGWVNERASKDRAGLFTIGAVGGALTIGTLVVVTNTDQPLWSVVTIGALAVLTIGAFLLGAWYSPLSAAGQEAALPWKAYRDGVKQSAKDGKGGMIDLDAVLPDSVAMGFTGALEKRLKAAGASGQPLRAFQGATGTDYATTGYFPYWLAFNSSVSSTSASSSTVSSSSAGGGGGSAGST